MFPCPTAVVLPPAVYRRKQSSRRILAYASQARQRPRPFGAWLSSSFLHLHAALALATLVLSSTPARAVANGAALWLVPHDLKTILLLTLLLIFTATLPRAVADEWISDEYRCALTIPTQESLHRPRISRLSERSSAQ